MSVTITCVLLLAFAISGQDAANLWLKHRETELPNEVVPVQADKLQYDPAARIINGKRASLGQFPWYVVTIGDSMALCGGSLISKNWILTAAHCTFSFDEFEIYLGSITLDLEDGEPVQITTRKRTHAGYNKTTHMNDIALLQLTKAVTFTASVKPIRLPDSSDRKTYVGQNGFVCGFGATSQGGESSDYLMYAELPIISKQECEVYYKSIVQSETLFCTLGRQGTSTCKGDSGGALTVQEVDGQYTQIGLVSFGSSNTCSNYPTGYTNVSSHLSWIQSQTGNMF